MSTAAVRDPGSGPVRCASCDRETRSMARWSPVIRRGEVVGHTCPACPKADEPIRRTVTGGGKVRFRVTIDAGRHPTGKRRQVTEVCDSLGDARKAEKRLRAELESGTFRARDAMTLDTLCDRWLESRRGEIREVSRKGYADQLKTVRARLGHRTVQSLTVADIEALRSWLATEGGVRGRGLSISSVRSVLVALRQVLDRAITAEHLIRENPARLVKSPKNHEADTDELERWTVAELLAFRAVADTDPWAGAWRLTLSGLRRSEVLGMAWPSIDLDAGTVAVQASRVIVGRATVTGRPKSAASGRTLHVEGVHPGSKALLKRLKLESAPSTSGLVLVDAAGEPIHPDAYSKRFGELCREAGVPVIHLHSVRHSVAYMLHEAGVLPADAAAFLGHTLTVHLDTYLWARSSAVASAAGRLGQAFAAAGAS